MRDAGEDGHRADDDPPVDRLLEDQEAEHDPDDRDDVRRPSSGAWRPTGRAAGRSTGRRAPTRAGPATGSRRSPRRSGVAASGCSSRKRQDQRVRSQRERDLEDRRHHRPQAADVASGVDRAAGVAEGRAEQREHRGQTRRPSPTARGLTRMTTPMNPTPRPTSAVEPDRLVGEEERGQHDDEQRDGRGQDGRQRRVDGLLGPGDQGERDRDVDRAHHREVAVDPSLAGQLRRATAGRPTRAGRRRRAAASATRVNVPKSSTASLMNR